MKNIFFCLTFVLFASNTFAADAFQVMCGEGPYALNTAIEENAKKLGKVVKNVSAPSSAGEFASFKVCVTVSLSDPNPDSSQSDDYVLRIIKR